MRARLPFLLVTAFFVTMNVLLWRSEFGAGRRLGAPLPAETVWEKVLTSPDHSSLEIRHRGVKIGRATWSASINESFVGELLNTDDVPPEGMVKAVTGYRLDFDASFTLEDLTRLKVDCHLNLSTNQAWQELGLKVALRPAVAFWEIRASAEAGTLRFLFDEGEGVQEKALRFADLRDPQALARSLGSPMLPAALATLGLSLPANPAVTNRTATPSPAPGLGLHWEARHDTLRVGRNPVRVYRVEARLFDRFKAAFVVSPVGEILRVELPNDIVLLNEALLNL
ncbi:MAG: hypothetical protein RJA22_311 [Verrucomicrobiota bacterium]|jgi:hypothetical protein